MITEGRGNLLDADVEALVNTVNAVGVMGKGVALQFRRAYPKMFDDYARAAKAGRVELGRMHVWPTGALSGPRYVINFPTKSHWRSRSRLTDLERGLVDLVRVIRELDIRSIAVPPLGCGNGGLDWRDVEPRIRAALDTVPEVDAVVYTPGGAPRAAEMRTATRRPDMTPGRSALIHLLRRYSERALEASLIEVQKLLYFLQVAGEPLRLNFARGRYGPYAGNIRHVLSLVEGHYLTGFGDGNSRVLDAEPIRLLPGADEAAVRVLRAHPGTAERIERVLALAEGFESAYGMELLASVHWVATGEETDAAVDPRIATRLVREWTPRKGRMYTPDHVRAAWDVLSAQGWIHAPASRKEGAP
ncbi:MAG: type II toxin-antitoxin system antitoxin DNA ADP-ribosyl glycohydrolase DarG [Streptosporangiaceae bacterium]